MRATSNPGCTRASGGLSIQCAGSSIIKLPYQQRKLSIGVSPAVGQRTGCYSPRTVRPTTFHNHSARQHEECTMTGCKGSSIPGPKESLASWVYHLNAVQDSYSSSKIPVLQHRLEARVTRQTHASKLHTSQRHAFHDLNHKHQGTNQ